MIRKLLRILFRTSIIITCLKAFNYTLLINQYTPQPNPYTRFGWNWRKATYCNLQLLFWNSIILLINDVYNNDRLRYIAGYLFVNIVRPISIVIGIICWFCILIQFPLVTWTNGDRWNPRWYGHTFYTLPLISVFIESFVQSHHTDGFKKALKVALSVQSTFALWHYLLWFNESHSPNKLFIVAWWKQVLTILSILLVTLIAISIGYLIDWGIFDLPLDTNDHESESNSTRLSEQGDDGYKLNED